MKLSTIQIITDETGEGNVLMDAKLAVQRCVDDDDGGGDDANYSQSSFFLLLALNLLSNFENHKRKGLSVLG